eukprot:CAMPEP_0114987488 /NCGR_PEP_ID=MMETSP0216-20121206/9036_1 /TAXON_ID=223996 /ORGANISM="Protocruzia adherens, Strain Boccale" /LENGTH=817 /DNA_ID=CAMNT_0002350093 /DNA_START=362 /DNA_END=2815 /DNA_ORIENTATION=+
MQIAKRKENLKAPRSKQGRGQRGRDVDDSNDSGASTLPKGRTFKNGKKQNFRSKGGYFNEEPQYFNPNDFRETKKQSASGKVDPSSITEVDLKALKPDELNNRFKQCRKAFSDLQTKTKQAFSSDMRYVRMREFFLTTSEELIAKHPQVAVQKQLLTKVWSALNKEIRKGDRSSNFSSANSDDEEEEDEDEYCASIPVEISAEMKNLLDENVDYFMRLLKALFKNYAPLNRPNRSDECVRQLCGQLLLILGDLERYKVKYSGQSDLTKAQDFYNKSHSLYPFNGKTCNQMAVVSGKKDDVFGSVYWLIRSLTTEKKFHCRETLNKYFEKVRQEFVNRLRELEAVSSGKMTTPQTSDDSEKIFMNFCFTFLRLQGIFFTRIGEEEVEKISFLLSSQFHNFTRFTKNLTNDDLKKKNINRLVHIMIIALFSLQNSVLGLDSFQEENPKITGEQVEGSPFGRHAVDQFVQLFLHLSSAVESATDYWMVALTPLMYWLFIHQEIMPYLVQKYPEIKRSILRLRRLIKKTEFQLSFDEVKDRELNLKEDIAENDVILYQILQGGLNEDFNFIGFMPLQHMFLTYKQKATTKYDGQALLEARAKIFQLVVNKASNFFEGERSDSESEEEIQEDPLDMGELPEGLEVGGVESKVLKAGSPCKSSKGSIVLDGPNVAIQHGDTYFSARGLKLAINYWAKRGYDVIAFLPENCLSYEKVASYKRAAKASFEISKAKMPDDVGMLIELKRQGFIATTPAQDYDDSYCIEYAKKNNSCIVSNDRYKDHVENVDETIRVEVKKWIRYHRISFTFAGDEFIPNPDFRFPE